MNRKASIVQIYYFTIIFVIVAYMFANSEQVHAEKSKTVGELLKKIEKKSEKVNFQKSKSALPQIKTQQQTSPTINLRDVKPPPSKKLYYEEGTDEAKLEKATDEGIDQLYTLAKRYKTSSKRGELWLRLAEQYVEKARLIEFRLINNHDVNMQSYLSGKIKNKPKLNLAPANIYNKKAIDLYEGFLRDFPQDSKVDQALFFLGFNYFELGDSTKGQLYYSRLTKEFPRSLYVIESNFALGEYYFNFEKWNEGLTYYSRVAQQKTNRLYSFALYKMAWCFYKLNQAKTGMKYIEQVIYEGRRSKGQKDSTLGGVSRIRLATEAIRDLIIFFAEAGDYKSARAYFEEVIGVKSAEAKLVRLATFYSDTGNKVAANAVFKDLIDQDPNAVKAFDYQYAIVKMYGTSGVSQIFKEELYTWIEQYGPGSSWQKINDKDRESIKKANEIIEALLRNHVLQLHQIAQNARTKTSIVNAKSAYELYFNTFSNEPKIDEIHFFYAELLFDDGDFEKSAGHYLWVVDHAKDSTYYDKAMLDALLAREKLLPAEDRIRKIVGDSTNTVEFDSKVKAFEIAALRFLAKYPNSENAVSVNYRMGALYYLYNQFDKAVPFLTELIKKHAKTPQAKYAANHLLDIFNLQKDYVGLQKTANEILAIPEIARSEVGAQIRDIKLKTDFKLAKELEDKKDYAGSAKAYEDFALRNRSSELAVGSVFNSAVNYERSGNIVKAIALYTVVSTNKSKASQDLAIKSSKFLPILYEKTGQYAKAAQLFEEYSRHNSKDPQAVVYNYNAAIIYDGLNAYSSAIKNYEIYFQ
ncbi:MAG: hypothetical protein A2Z20_00855, partial [Bdellovibrionales bacterium RBG_16_40_8]